MRFIILIAIVAHSLALIAQGNCPPGTEQIWAKCNGVMEERCVPSKEDCGCSEWRVAYYRKDNPQHEWGGVSDPSYAKVEQQLQKDLAWKDPNPNSNLVFTLHSQIYCTKGQLCNRTSFDVTLFDKIVRAVKELKAKLDQLRQAYDDFPVVERAKPGLAGYLTFIEDADKAADKAYQKAMEYQKQPLKEVEEELNADVSTLNGAYLDASEKILYIQSENTKRNEQKGVQDQQQSQRSAQQQINAQNQAAQQKALNDFYQYQQDQNRQNQQNINNSFNQLTGAINTLGQNMAQTNQNDIARLQNEIDAQKRTEANEKEKQHQQELVLEKQKLEQQKDLAFWEEKSRSILSNLYNISKGLMPDDVASNKMDSVYFIFWNFTDRSNIKLSSPVPVTKSADGDWPALRDVKNLMTQNYGFQMSTTPNGTGLGEKDLNYSLGYFKSMEEAKNAFDKLMKNAETNGFTAHQVDILLNKPQKKMPASDFWKE